MFSFHAVTSPHAYSLKKAERHVFYVRKYQWCCLFAVWTCRYLGYLNLIAFASIFPGNNAENLQNLHSHCVYFPLKTCDSPARSSDRLYNHLPEKSGFKINPNRTHCTTGSNGSGAKQQTEVPETFPNPLQRFRPAAHEGMRPISLHLSRLLFE